MRLAGCATDRTALALHPKVCQPAVQRAAAVGSGRCGLAVCAAVAQRTSRSSPAARSAAATWPGSARSAVGGKSQAANPSARTRATRAGSSTGAGRRSSPSRSCGSPGSTRSKVRPRSSQATTGSRPVSNQMSAVSRSPGARTSRGTCVPSCPSAGDGCGCGCDGVDRGGRAVMEPSWSEGHAGRSIAHAHVRPARSRRSRSLGWASRRAEDAARRRQP